LGASDDFIETLVFSLNDVFHHVKLNEGLLLGRVLDSVRVDEEEIGMGKDELNDSFLVLFDWE
jgi:hypothetical protein